MIYIHATSGIRTHDPSAQEGQENMSLRRRGHWDRLDTNLLWGHKSKKHKSHCQKSLLATRGDIPGWGFLRKEAKCYTGRLSS